MKTIIPYLPQPALVSITKQVGFL